MMDAMVPFKYSLPGAVSFLSPEDGSSAIHHVCFQITKKVRFSLVFTLLLFTNQVISQKLVVSKGNSRSGVDPLSSGLADPAPSPSCPIPAAEPVDAGLGRHLFGGHVPGCSQGRTAWPERTWVKPAQRNLR